MRYSIELAKPFAKSYGFLSFTQNMYKNIGKYIINKYNQKPFDHVKQIATDALKSASKRAIQNTAEATGDLIGHKIADRNTGTLPQSSPETVPSKTTDIEFDTEESIEVPKERQIYPPKKVNKLLKIIII